MKRKSLLAFALLCAVCMSSAFAQNNSDNAQTSDTKLVTEDESAPWYCYRVYLTDKEGTPYSVSRPEEFLSQRALDRRARYGIAITEEDLPLNPAYVAQIRAAARPVYMPSQSKWTNTLTLMLLDTSTLDAVQALPCVREVMPIGIHPSDNLELEVEDYGSIGYLPGGLDYYGYGFPQMALHNGHLLHNEGFHGEGMLIAMMDCGWYGFDQMPSMQHLYEENRILGTYDVLPFTQSIYNQHDHGTFCTSEIIANIPNYFVGAAPEADLAFIRTEDVTVEILMEEDFWVRGAEIADSIGADVISSSIAYTTFDDNSTHPLDYSTCNGEWSIASAAATMAAHKGMVLSISAGNDGDNWWQKISRPSDAKDVLCVGAVNPDGVRASFSSMGPSYDGRVKPDVVSCGAEMYALNSNDTVMWMFVGGTSSSAPIIAGLAACLWQAMPQYNALEIMQIIRESSHQYDNPDIYLGYGIPDFYQAWLQHGQTGISENQVTTDISVFPNPCSDKMQLLNRQSRTVRYELFDMAGRLVLRNLQWNRNPILSIDLSDCKSGIYFLKVDVKEGKSEVLKVVKE